MKNLWNLITTMLKIGLIGFGGGNALVPVIERETVEGENALITKEEYEKDIIVANITPGALPVELASGIGKKAMGNRGMVLGALAMAFPGALLTFVLLALYTQLAEPVTRQVRYASVGIGAMIILLLCSYSVVTVMGKVGKKQEFRISLLLIIVVFALTNGKSMNGILGIDQTPMFAISTLNVLAITFFVIFFTRGHLRSRKTLIAAVISVLYLLSVGKMQLIASLAVRHTLQLLMAVLGGHGLICSIGGEENKLRSFPFRSVLKETACWVGLVVLLCLPALILRPGCMLFIGKALVSVMLSFGGGDAYLVVAKGLFVGSDMITSNEFYGQIVTIANAMPGSILCKILTGVGFTIGKHHSAVDALCMGLAGFGCGVGASGLTFLWIYRIYDQFEDLQIFQAIKTYIRPIIGGLLLTVALSMLKQNISTGAEYGISAATMVVVSLAIVALALLLRSKKHCRLLTLIIVTAASSILICNLFCPVI